MQSGTQLQAANQVSISNSIGSLRFLAAMDWRKFVETMSVVEHKLREDPEGHYGTHGLRHARPVPARRRAAREGQPLPEVDVARRAIELAHEAAPRRRRPMRAASHVGFYLIDAGRTLLERAVGVREGAWQGCFIRLRRVASVAYRGGDHGADRPFSLRA